MDPAALTPQAITVTAETTIDELFDLYCKLPSDINKHLPKLRELASQVDHVTEFGIRGGKSTAALLAGRPKKLVSYDIDPHAVEFSFALRHLKHPPVEGRGPTVFQPRCGDTREVLIETTDLLFIDSLHTFEQLRAELKRHGNKASTYLVFHDTAPDAFGYKGEDGSEPGLRAAIRWFQEQSAPRWQLVYDSHENNGLLVLQRHKAFGIFVTAEAFAGPEETA